MGTVIYPLMFIGLASSRDRGEIGWAWALAISQSLVVLASPLVGAIADQRASKKRFLAATWLFCVIGCAALSWTHHGPIGAAWVIFVFANLAFSLGENLVAAFLPEIAAPAEMGRLSGIGWAVGYFGGLASLAICLVLVKSDQTRWVPLLTAGFFLLSGVPTFLFLRERAKPRGNGRVAVAAAIAEVKGTFARRRDFPDLFRLLLVLFLEQAGVSVVIGLAAVYAESEYALKQADTIKLFIGLQIAAAAGAAAFGFLQDKIGGKRALAGTIVTWLAAVLFTLLSHDIVLFCVGAAIAGVAMGSSQASGRAMVGVFTPPARQGEWFGLWGLAMKSSAVLGLAVFAIVREWGSIRAAMWSTAVFFVLSLLVLRGLDERRGIRAAHGARA
jgi:UMF1 family MFS transporter